MLTLFILKSGAPNADMKKTISSFERTGIPFKPVVIEGWRDVNNYRDKGDWYGIFWDNEGIDGSLGEVLETHLTGNWRAEALILYKRVSEKEAEYRARFMRKSIWMTHDFAPLASWINYETVLDGWVIEHG